MEYMPNMNPIIPVAIDLSMRRDVTSHATIIRTIAPQRSNTGARLKNAHHTRTANAPTIAANIPRITASGRTTGTTSQPSNISAAAAMPGHNRSGFRGAGSPV